MLLIQTIKAHCAHQKKNFYNPLTKINLLMKLIVKSAEKKKKKHLYDVK